MSDAKIIPAVPDSMEEQMNLKAVINDVAKIDYLPDNCSKVTIPYRSDGWRKNISKIFRLPSEKTFELDDLGTELISWCDGKTTFETMITNYQKRWKLTFFEAHALLFKFFTPLLRNNIVIFIGK